MIASRRLPAVAARSTRSLATATTLVDPSGSASVQVSRTAQGVRVATFEDQASPVAGLSLVLNAGTRHESSETIGLAHYLKNFAFKSTQQRTSLRIVREAELQGAVLYSDVSRETVSYRVRFLREDWAYFANLLAEVATAPKLAKYDLPEVAKLVKEESAAALADPTAAVLDALHRVAFRNGLGNSLYARDGASVSVDAVRDYLFTNSPGLTVVGHGVEHAALVETLERAFGTHQLAPVPTSSGATHYHGGDLHLAPTPATAASGNAVCALAFPVESASDRATARVLRHLLGGEKRVKWATGQSPLAVLAQQHGAAVSGLNLEYSDAALVGFLIHAPSNSLRAATHDVVGELRKVADGQLGQEAVARALAVARLESAAAVEPIDARLSKVGEEVSATNKATSLAETIKSVSTVQSSDIVGLAKRLIKSRSSLAAAGNPHDLPFSDELGL